MRRLVLAGLTATPAELARVARAADQAPRNGAWSPAWVVLHLAVVEEQVWHRRLRDLETLDRPLWSWTEPDLGEGPGDRSLDALLEAFASARRSTLERAGALDETGWARRGVHQTFGELEVAALLGEALKHDEEHLAELRAR